MTVAAYVQKLANEAGITADRTLGDELISAITRHTGAAVELGEVETLLIKLAQRKIISTQKMTELIILHKSESSED